jgi:acetylornithine/succinyldiaminopimelate/putrescine aminotransferase
MSEFERLLLEAKRNCGANYRTHVNPAFAELLDATGFSRCFVRGEGASLWDEQGHEYLDCIAGYAVHAIGRKHPDMVQALCDALVNGPPNWVQFEKNPLAALLARRLCDRVPGELQHVFFSNTGTEGVECALKLARRATGRSAVLHCDMAFHGLTIGSLAANGNPGLRKGFGDLGPSEQIPFDDLAALEQALSSRRFAAFIVEPVQGKTCRALAPGYLTEASRLAQRHGTLLVIDEVQTGVGRTGSFVASARERGVRPDMVVLSKALSGGYVPIGATLVRRDIWRRTFDSMSRALVHASTFQGNVLAMTAGLMTLEIHDREQLSARAARLGSEIRGRLKALSRNQPLIGEVRGEGLMIGVSLQPPLGDRLLARLPSIGTIARHAFGQAFVMNLLERHRVLCQVTESTTNVLKFTPPLVVSSEQCERLVCAIEDSLVALSPSPATAGVAKVVRNLTKRP